MKYPHLLILAGLVIASVVSAQVPAGRRWTNAGIYPGGSVPYTPPTPVAQPQVTQEPHGPNFQETVDKIAAQLPKTKAPDPVKMAYSVVAKLRREVSKVISRLEEIGVLHKLTNRSEDIYRVEPIIRAKIPIESLQTLMTRLVAHNQTKGAEETSEESTTEAAK